MTSFSIEWIDGGKEPRVAADPNFPAGKDLPAPSGCKKACRVHLPYPAKRIGFYVISCRDCGVAVACTTAGRSDDPRSIDVPCRPKPRDQVLEDQP